MKYQVVLLGTPWNENEIIQGLSNLPNLTLVSFDDLNMDKPFLCLYFGQSGEDSQLSKEVKENVNDILRHHALLPITMFPDAFKSNIPNEFKAINGFFLKNNDKEGLSCLKNWVASYFGLIDTNKKIFISYRRTDLEELAHRLYEELIKRKYHPFLDSYTIVEGVDFQEHLRHELIDSEIVIILDSPDFNSSAYCMEEFNIANRERIPVLDIRFNVNPSKNLHRFCDYIETELSCKEANVNSDLVGKIIELMEQSRFKAYKFKRQYILDEFESLCQEYGMNIVNQGLFLRCDTTHECFYPLTRIPSCHDLYNLKVMFDKVPLFSTYAKKIIYNGSYCRPGIESYLQWLNSQLPVTSYNITK